ncbi:Nn.00g045400.m01.CDS01 [Neocucurbitaria sp. VM-36]
MASATPPTILPRSKFSASVPTADPAHSPATINPGEAAAYRNTKYDWQAAEDPDFIHPDHVIPPRSYDGIEHLIIVCCHAVFLPDAESSSFPLHSPHHEPHWLLASFQKSDPNTGKPGEHETFLAHVKVGLDALTVGTDPEHPPSSLLVLSGGTTQPSQTPISEARSYYHAALAEELSEGHLHGGRAHRMFSKGYVLLEEHATDSFQNLLFSILLFRRTTGRYPKDIRIITHAFKARRFLDLHAPTIRWPKDRVQVQGIDPVMSSTELDSTLHGEEQNGYSRWKDDPLGTGELLSEKRRQRAWDESVVKRLAEGLEPSIRELLQGSVPAQLPWEPSTTKNLTRIV